MLDFNDNGPYHEDKEQTGGAPNAERIYKAVEMQLARPSNRKVTPPAVIETGSRRV